MDEPILSGSDESAISRHGNDLSTEGNETLCPPLNCEVMLSTPRGIQDPNTSTIPLPPPSCDSADGSNSSSNNESQVFYLPLDSRRSSPDQIPKSPLHCKPPPKDFWRKCFACLSPPEGSADTSQSEDWETLSSEPNENNAVEVAQNEENSPADGSHSVNNSNANVYDATLHCKTPVKANKREQSVRSKDDGSNVGNKHFIPNSQETNLSDDNGRTVSPVRVTCESPSNSCSAQLALTPVRVYRKSCGDYTEVSLLAKKNDLHSSLSDVSHSNKKDTAISGSRKGPFNLRKRLSSISSLTKYSENSNSKADNLKESKDLAPNFELEIASILEDSKILIIDSNHRDLARLPIKSIDTQSTEGEYSAHLTNLIDRDRKIFSQGISSNSSDLTLVNKISSKSNISLVESFSEPTQHFNMSNIHKDIRMMRLKSEELPSFHSPGSPTSSLLCTAATTTSTPLRSRHSALALSLLKTTQSSPVTPIRSQTTIETSSEYPLKGLVRQDNANKVHENSSLCPNISYVNPDHDSSNLYSPVSCNLSYLISQSESEDSGEVVEFVSEGNVIRKIDFSEEVLEETAGHSDGNDRPEGNPYHISNSNKVPWLQKLLSRTLDSTELRMCNLACQMAWELQENVYDEIYERLSHMETYDEHYRIEETSRYKIIYVEKIEKLWHFIVPLFKEKYWDRRSMKVVKKNLLTYGNRRLNAKQWEYANFHDCIFDVACVFNYGLYAYETSNPVFDKDNIHNFLVPNYTPDVSAEEVNE